MKKLFATLGLMGVILIGSSTAQAGLLMSDFTGKNTKQTCSQKSRTSSKTNKSWGIFVTSFTGIIVAGFTGIIVAGATEAPAECGILMAD